MARYLRWVSSHSKSIGQSQSILTGRRAADRSTMSPPRTAAFAIFISILRLLTSVLASSWLFSLFCTAAWTFLCSPGHPLSLPVARSFRENQYRAPNCSDALSLSLSLLRPLTQQSLTHPGAPGHAARREPARKVTHHGHAEAATTASMLQLAKSLRTGTCSRRDRPLLGQHDAPIRHN